MSPDSDSGAGEVAPGEYRGLPISSSRSPHLPTPAPDSAGPRTSREERLAGTGAFTQQPGLTPTGREPAGPAVVHGAPRGGTRATTSFSCKWASPRPGRASSRRFSNLGPGREEDSGRGPFCPRLVPVPGGSAG